MNTRGDVMTKKLLLLAGMCLFASLLMGAVEAAKKCPVCKEPITKKDYCLIQNNVQVHRRHALEDDKREQRKQSDALIKELQKVMSKK
jgi:hypothetical protein